MKRPVAAIVALALMVTAGRFVVPVAVQRTLDDGLHAAGGPDLPLIRTTIAVAVVALLASTACGFLLVSQLARLAEFTLADLRTKAFAHVHAMSPIGAAERRGSLVSRVTSDVDTVSAFVQWGGLTVLVASGQLVLATVIMAVWSWQLTVVVYVAFVPLVIALTLLRRRLDGAYSAVRARLGDLVTAVAEPVVGAAVVRAFGIESRTERRINERVDVMLAAQQRAQRVAVVAFSTGELVAAAATAAVLVVGVLLGAGGHLTAGRLVGFVFLVTLFVQPVQVATEVLNEAQNARASLRRVRELIAAPITIRNPDGPGVALPPGPLTVDVVHVSFGYDDETVLHDVTLHVPARKRFAIVGETGSGKSTLVRLLVRLMDPTTGQIRLSGVPLREARLEDLRRRVVMVPQEPHLFQGSIADNVRWGDPQADDAAVGRCFVDLGLAEWIASLPLGVGTEVGERGSALSVGERQLVALARAHIADPDLLILDEATSALDPITELQVQRALHRLTAGRTTIAIAHRLSTARIADTVVVIDRGRIAEVGRHVELVDSDGVYSSLFRAWLGAVTTPTDDPLEAGSAPWR
jgi:ABC-type multidrug transport system fused ATPase/permease subunit